MQDFMKFLTDEDRRLLMQNAEHASYAPEEVILREGDRRHALFVIRSGEVRVERSHMGFNLEIARLPAGEVFGEMSLIEEHPASASVIAAQPVEVVIIDESAVRSLVERDAAFAGRFYQSLALILSHRLRETTEVGIAEYSWGGQALEQALAGEEDEGRSWGGGSPLREP